MGSLEERSYKYKYKYGLLRGEGLLIQIQISALKRSGVSIRVLCINLPATLSKEVQQIRDNQ